MEINVLYIGDISGSVGRDTVKQVLPGVTGRYKPDLVVANVENAAGGYGVTREVIEEMLSLGVDLTTGGDHTFAIKDFYEEIDDSLPFLRAANYEAPSLPGIGWKVIDMGSKGSIAIISLIGMEFFSHTQRIRNPFWFIDELLEIPEIKQADMRVVEYHAETTSEKLAFGWYVRDRVDAVVGTHTHVATADNRLLEGKVAYVTDIGQVGPYEASLWVDFESVIHNFKYPNRKPFKLAETGPRIFNSVLITFENNSPKSIERVDVVVE